MFERNIPDKELEKLSKAITDAILNSKNVKKIIKEIREKDLILSNTLMVIVLKIEALSNISNNLNDVMKNLKNSSNKKEKKAIGQFIDGKELKPCEIAFQEFLVEKFDTKKWLKKNGLIL